MPTGELEQATRRLQTALDRLEQAIDARDGSGEDLRSALEAAQRENAALRDLTDTVAGRLDTTIARLKTVLKG